ncbi:MAG TPA: hypothetical protein PLS54_11565 [Syntrophomonadaceae bacterium]|nr:hypothetical protein [Syntrophomonadaceae bacterium]
MTRIYTTGAVENAAANSSVNLFVKVLNNNETQPVQAEITLYSLDGVKNVVSTAVREIPPLSSDFEIFDITNVLQFEVQIRLNPADNVFVTVWGKDANANLVAAHRFVTEELSVLSNSSPSVKKSKQSSLSPRSRRHR